MIQTGLKIVLLAGILAGIAPQKSPDNGMFPDVPNDHWAYSAVKSLKERGIIEGYPAVPKKTAPKRVPHPPNRRRK